MFRFNIKFKYCDEMSKGKWREQSCSLCACNAYEARSKCIELYGLNECEYQILSIEKVDD